MYIENDFFTGHLSKMLKIDETAIVESPLSPRSVEIWPLVAVMREI